MSSLSPLLTARARAGAGLLMAGLLALTACGRDDAEPVPAPSMATATEALPSMDMTPFTLDVPSLGLEKVPGASLAVLEGEDPEYHAAWLSVPGAPAWTAAMDRAVRDQVAAYERDTDRAADPVLDIQPRLAVAGTDAAATRLLATERRGDRSVSAVQTVWYSAREDRVASTRDLFTDRGWDDFRNEVRERMTTDPAIVQDRLTSAVEQPDRVENARVWDALALLPDGSALLEVDQAAMAPADAGILTARIPADIVRPWLSEVGLAAQDAARTPGTVRLPERAPSSSTPATAPGSPTGVPGGAAPAPGTISSTPGGPIGSGAPGSATDPGSAPAPGSSSGSDAGTDVGASTPAPSTPAPSTSSRSASSAPPAPPAPSSSGGTSGAPGGPTTSAPAPTPTDVTPAPVPVPVPTSPSAPAEDPTPTAPGETPSPAPTSSATAPTPAPPSSSQPDPTTAPAPEPVPVPVPVPVDPSTPAPPPSDTAPTATPDPSATATTDPSATATTAAARSETRSGTRGRPTDQPVGGPASERRASPKAEEPTPASESGASSASAVVEATASPTATLEPNEIG